MMTKMVNEKIADMLVLLEELREDSTIPRNVKEELEFCTNCLQENSEISLRIDKVRHALEGICDDSNLQAYTRTQLWNISSMLETL